MQCVRISAVPSIGWDRLSGTEVDHDIRMKLLAGGCYKEEFARIGDIIPTSFILNDQDIGKGINLVFAGMNDLNSSIDVALGTLKWEKRATIQEMVDLGNVHLAENCLDDCLEVILEARRIEEGMTSRDLQELGKNLSLLFYQLAEKEEVAANSIADIGRTWDLYWKACEAWRGNSEALLKCADLWRYNLLVAGWPGAGAVFERNAMEEGEPVSRYQEILQRSIAPVFPLDKLRLGSQVANLDFSSVPEVVTEKTFLTGWGGREHWGRWAMKTQSSILVDVPLSETEGSSELVLRMASWQDNRPPQKIKVSFEGEEIGEIVLDGRSWDMQSYRFKVPLWQGKAVITFSVEGLIPDPEGKKTLRAFPLESWEIVQQ